MFERWAKIGKCLNEVVLYCSVLYCVVFSRLRAASEGTGMLDVLHCVLIDSPEALNAIKVGFVSFH